MKKNTYTLIALSLLLFQGCSLKEDTNIDKEKTLKKVNAIIAQHKNDKEHSALAIAVDENSKYLLGYAQGSKSEENASKIAMEQCVDQSSGKELKEPCEIYLLNGKEIRTLE